MTNTVRQEILMLMEELRKLSPSHFLLKYSDLFNFEESVSAKVVEEFDTYFGFCAGNNTGQEILEAYRETLRRKIESLRAPRMLRLLPELPKK